MDFKGFLFQYKIGEDVYRKEVKSRSFTVGRSDRCDIKIDFEIVSRKHMRVSFRDKAIKVMDLGSTNGVVLNGVRLKPHKEFDYRAGDELSVEGAGLRCGFEIRDLFEKSESRPPVDPLEVQKEPSSFVMVDEVCENPSVPESPSVENKSDSFGEEVSLRFREMVSGDVSVSGIRGNDNRDLDQSDSSIGGDVDRKYKDLNLENQGTLLKSQISELRGFVVQSEKDVQKRKEDIDGLREEIVQKQKELEESELKNQKFEKRLDQLHERLSEAEGSFHFISEMRKQRIREDQNSEEAVWSQTQAMDYEEIDSGLGSGRESTGKTTEGGSGESPGLEMDRLKGQIGPEVREGVEILLGEASLKVQNTAKEAQKQIREIVGQVGDQAHRDFATTRKELERKKADVRAEIQDFYSGMDENKERLKRELDKMSREAREEIDSRLKKLRDELEVELEAGEKNKMGEVEEQTKKRIKELESRAERRMKEVEAEVDGRLRESQRQAREIGDRVQQHIDDLNKVEKEIEGKKAKVEEDVKDLHSQMETDKKNFEEELKRMKEKVEQEITVDSERLKLELETERETDTAKKLEEVKRQAHEIMTQAHRQADEDISAAERKIEKKKRAADAEIQSLRSNTIKKFQRQREFLEQEEKRHNHLKAVRLRKELNEVLRVHIKPYLKDEENLDKVSSVIDKTVNAIVSWEIDESFIEGEHNVDVDLYRKKARNFWLISGLSTLAVVAFFVFLPTFRKVVIQTGRDIATEDAKQTEKKIIKVRAANDFSKEFRPGKIDKFLGTYTDRVLYTRGYVAIELFKEYRQKWILELQDYFTEKLKLSENHLVPFIAQESNLIRELDKAMGKINGHFVDRGIGRMREIEKDFEKKLQAHLGKKNDYRKIMAFKKAFFEKNADEFRKKASLK